MTYTPTEQEIAEAEKAQPVYVTPDLGSRLEQLHAAYESAKAQADEATKTLKAITDGIKLELSQAAPEFPKIQLVSQLGPPLRMTYAETWRFDSTRFKRDDPETYVRYAKKGGSWSLRVAQGGDE